MKNKILILIMILMVNIGYAKNDIKIDKATFQEIDGGFAAKDKNGVYVRISKGWKKLELDPVTFQIINVYGSMYLKDKNGIYSLEGSYDEDLYLKKMPYDVKTFEGINQLYSKDKNNIYYKERKIIGVDLSTFERIDEYIYSKDKNNIYFRGKKILDVDISTFEKIDEYQYSKDKNNIYYENKKIEGVDKNTFQLINDYYSKDKNNVYYENKKLKGIDVKTFKITSVGIIEDKNGFYIVEEDGNVVPLDSKKVDIKNLIRLAIKTNLYRDKDSMYFVKNHKLEKIKNAPKVVPFSLSVYNDNYIKKYDEKYDAVYYLDTDEGAFKKIEETKLGERVTVFDTEYAKGKKNIYFKGKILTSADYASFEMKYNEKEDVYEIRDKNRVYKKIANYY